ncbi:MAG: CRISPR-associated endonuclease Cas2 [Acidobacteria bacterium]|nr:CRISPR-associated endonuclease Cas2 [Acidobacteriota bacterium]
MALSQPRNWLIAYDISDHRRLRRVHRFLRGHAVPVQYSVFATRASPMALGVMRAALASLVDPKNDDVRMYPVPEPAVLSVYGRKALPEGLQVVAPDTALGLAPFRLEPPLG